MTKERQRDREVTVTLTVFSSPSAATKYGCPFSTLRAEFAAAMPVFLINEYRSSQLCARCGGWCGLVGWSKRLAGRQTGSNGARHLCLRCDPVNPRAMHRHGPSKDITACENIFRRGLSLLTTEQVPASLRRPTADFPVRPAKEAERYEATVQAEGSKKLAKNIANKEKRAKAAEAANIKRDAKTQALLKSHDGGATAAATPSAKRKQSSESESDESGDSSGEAASSAPDTMSPARGRSKPKSPKRKRSKSDESGDSSGQAVSSPPGASSARGSRKQSPTPQKRKRPLSKSDKSGDSSGQAASSAPDPASLVLPSRHKTYGMGRPPQPAAPHPPPIQGDQSPEALDRVADMDQDDGPPSARGPGRGRGSIRARGTRIGMGHMPMSRQGGPAAATPHMHGDHHLHDLDDRSEQAAAPSPTA